MKFGAFDHVDRSGLALADQFDKRLEYVAALEEAGLYSDLAEYEIRMARENRWPANAEHPLVNDGWDRAFLAALERGDETYVAALSFEQVEREGGHGAHEIINWLALMGAMDGAPAQIVAYEAVPDWICGMAYVDFMPARQDR